MGKGRGGSVARVGSEVERDEEVAWNLPARHGRAHDPGFRRRCEPARCGRRRRCPATVGSRSRGREGTWTKRWPGFAMGGASPGRARGGGATPTGTPPSVRCRRRGRTQLPTGGPRPACGRRSGEGVGDEGLPQEVQGPGRRREAREDLLGALLRRREALPRVARHPRQAGGRAASRTNASAGRSSAGPASRTRSNGATRRRSTTTSRTSRRRSGPAASSHATWPTG